LSKSLKYLVMNILKYQKQLQNIYWSIKSKSINHFKVLTVYYANQTAQFIFTDSLGHTTSRKHHLKMKHLCLICPPDQRQYGCPEMSKIEIVK
jgi:hypothetical protein